MGLRRRFALLNMQLSRLWYLPGINRATPSQTPQGQVGGDIEQEWITDDELRFNVDRLQEIGGPPRR